MKNLSFILFILLCTSISKSLAQSPKAADFFAGKWEIAITGSPRGDVTFLTTLVRKEGKLTGELVSGEDKRPITKAEETATSLSLYFMSSQGGEVPLDLNKVDENNLKGSLMGFNATATRIKEKDFYAGKWEVSIMGTPNGDSKMVTELVRKDGRLTGELKDPTGGEKPTAIDEVEESPEKLIIRFVAQGFNLDLTFDKVDDNNLKGSLMNGRFEASAKRMKE